MSKEIIGPPKGENSYDHAKRIKHFLDELYNKYPNKTIIIVGHGGTNKVIIGILKGLNPEEFYNVKQDHACINILELDNQFNLIKSNLNLTTHLK
ncbi:MAG: histidine phosphatase family protein [Nanoarchaeota archaeon]|nr:histidine phosphatase family protein [Nanoarchaeota archaeon]